MPSRIRAKVSDNLAVSTQRVHAYCTWFGGSVLFLALSALSKQMLSTSEIIYSGLLLSISIVAYLSWRKGNHISVPVWAMVCVAHFIFYGLPIFGALRKSPSAFDHGNDLPDSAISAAMLVGVVGLSSIAIGRTFALQLTGRRTIRFSFLRMTPQTPLRIQVLLSLGIIINVFGIPFYGTPIWNISVIAFNSLPLAAFLWLIVGRGVRGLSAVDLCLSVAFLLTRLFSGARFNASLGTIVVPLYLIGLGALAAKKRLPWRMIALVTCIVLFLQPSKSTIRQEISHGALDDSFTQSMVRWVQVAASGWEDVFSGRKPLDEQLAPTESRSSLLTMTGVILERTPERVPFQLGSYYPLLIKNLIPRVLWPEKPSVNVANQFFQVKYGLTDREHLSSVSIACGFEAEGYMNFRWYGVIGIGVLVGIVLGVYETASFGAGAGRTAIAIGLALLPGFLTIESQLVQYLGGILQFALAAAIVFHQPRAKESASMPWTLAISGRSPTITPSGKDRREAFLP
jgi:hypothetical protein